MSLRFIMVQDQNPELITISKKQYDSLICSDKMLEAFFKAHIETTWQDYGYALSLIDD